MLRIYDDVLTIIRQVRPLLDKLRTRSRALADQGERALGQVPLRIAEGSYSRGKNRAVHYHGGAGSMQETIGVFDTVAAFGHLPELDPQLRDHMKKCVAVLFKNAR
jgi:hypothetical protein